MSTEMQAGRRLRLHKFDGLSLFSMDSQIPTVGVAMIARDCAETIARALCSVRTIARQIVVLDTGSHDRTPTVAARLGAEVYFHPWRNDFSDARNLALDYLRTDWVLVLDSDEELDGESFRAHCPNLADPMIGGVELTIVSALEGGITTAEHRYTRLFRRHRDIRFEGAIHEQIAASIQRAGFEIARSQVRILHYGYQTVQPEKIERNIALLHAELERQPDSPWLRYNLGLAYFAAGKFDSAAALLAPLCTCPELSAEQRELARLRAAQCALAQDRLLEAEQLLEMPCNDSHHEGLRRFIVAGVLAARRKFASALEALEHPSTCASGLVNQLQRERFCEHLRALGATQRLQARTLFPLGQSHAEWQTLFR